MRVHVDPISGRVILLPKEKPAKGGSSGGSGAWSLDALNDVTLTSPSNNQILKYNGSQWVNGAASGGDGTIQQYDSDPASPTSEVAWVLRTAGAAGTPAGNPIGLLLSLTSAGTAAGADTYQLSYRTLEGTTIRIGMS